MKIQNKQETKSSERESLLQSGLEPALVDDLEQAQQAYKEMGMDLSLEETYSLEVDQAPSEFQETRPKSPSQQATDFDSTVGQSLIDRGVVKTLEEAKKLLKEFLV
jgi:organic radical activating enzyme